MRLETPETASPWPIFDLAEPRYKVCSSVRPFLSLDGGGANVSKTLVISTLSPAWVPLLSGQNLARRIQIARIELRSDYLRPVHLDISDTVRINATLAQYFVEDGLLCPFMWPGNRYRLSRVVCVSTENDTKDRIIIRNGIV